MKDFSTSLARERITFSSKKPPVFNDGEEDVTPPIVIKNNRVALNLVDGITQEAVVIRTQSAHLALIIANKIMFSFHRNGLFMKRDKPYEWDKLWESSLSEYEQAYNPLVWGAIYINSNAVFRTAENYHMDIIEKCSVLHSDSYDTSMEKAETVFAKLGLDLKIEQDLSIAAIFNDQTKEKIMRCGIVQRHKGRNQTINFVAEGGEAFIRIENGLLAASAFLEAMNLNMTIRALKAMVNTNDVKNMTAEGRRLRSATARRNDLYKLIKLFEKNFKVHYRPEKPDLFSE